MAASTATSTNVLWEVFWRIPFEDRQRVVDLCRGWNIKEWRMREYLDLERTTLRDLDPRLLMRAVEHLTTVKLSRTQLTKVQLEYIISGLGDGFKIKELDVSFNNMRDVYHGLIPRLGALVNLNIGSTHLTLEQIQHLMTSVVSESSHMTKLNVSNLNMGSIEPSIIGRLTKLSYLCLSGTRLNTPQLVTLLTAISGAEMGGLSQLETLDLSYNYFLSLVSPGLLLVLNRLKNVDLHSTCLKAPQLNEFFFSFSSEMPLHTLDVSWNDLSSVDPFAVAALKELDYVEIKETRLQLEQIKTLYASIVSYGAKLRILILPNYDERLIDKQILDKVKDTVSILMESQINPTSMPLA